MCCTNNQLVPTCGLLRHSILYVVKLAGMSMEYSCAFCYAFGGVKSKPGKAAHFTKVFFMSTYSPLYHHHQQCNCNFAHSTCLSYAPASTFFPHQKICSLGNKKGMRGKYCISYQLLFALKSYVQEKKSTITCCTLPD